MCVREQSLVSLGSSAVVPHWACSGGINFFMWHQFLLLHPPAFLLVRQNCNDGPLYNLPPQNTHREQSSSGELVTSYTGKFNIWSIWNWTACLETEDLMAGDVLVVWGWLGHSFNSQSVVLQQPSANPKYEECIGIFVPSVLYLNLPQQSTRRIMCAPQELSENRPGSNNEGKTKPVNAIFFKRLPVASHTPLA